MTIQRLVQMSLLCIKLITVYNMFISIGPGQLTGQPLRGFQASPRRPSILITPIVLIASIILSLFLFLLFTISFLIFVFIFRKS